MLPAIGEPRVPSVTSDSMRGVGPPRLHSAMRTASASSVGALKRTATSGSSSSDQAGAMLRNLLGLSAEEENAAEEIEKKVRAKEELIAAAQALESQRQAQLQSEGTFLRAKDEKKKIKKAELLRKIQEESASRAALALEPPLTPDDDTRGYGYQGDSPEKHLSSQSFSPTKGVSTPEAEHYGYVSPPRSPRGDSEEAGTITRPEDAQGANSAVATVSVGYRKALFRDAARKSINSNVTGLQLLANTAVKIHLMTPGFVLLQELTQSMGKKLHTQERDLWRLIKKHYAVIKKERAGKHKAAGKTVMLTGDLKKRAALSEKLKSAVLAVCAARREQGPQVFGQISKAMDARVQLQHSPEFKAVQLLQRCVRRVQPLAFHPGIGPTRPLSVRLHTVWAAHVALSRLAKVTVNTFLSLSISLMLAPSHAITTLQEYVYMYMYIEFNIIHIICIYIHIYIYIYIHVYVYRI
jgi:hypothetical protein